MNLKNVIPWGRSLKEYQAIFNLNEADLQKNILGCGDGPAAFNCELTRQGGPVTSIDPTYCFSTQEFTHRINEVVAEVIPQVEANKDAYIWQDISSVKQLEETRMEAGEIAL